MLRLLLATRNAHKAREFAQILGTGYEITDLTGESDVPEVAEDGRTFEENAITKAVEVSRIVPGLVVGDDSGLEVAALGGAPGVYSARYAGGNATDQENVAKLLAELSGSSRERSVDQGARFCCALALASSGRTVAVFRGEVTGTIIERPRGGHGFGYDPVFVPSGFDQTIAELGDEVKNRISHRAHAINQLRQYLAGGGELLNKT